ncbi:MAG: HAMP domain-containing histidine kinase [Clostridium sp.]|nr:HAMP domain-containing histidine kinase [Clostridium sp.]MCM1459652.1 HAMP domain-containing histidine kinase [Bacteroides sp.]
MEALKKKWNDLPLKRFLVLTVLCSIGIVAVLSAVIVGGCVTFRHWLLPNPNEVYLTMEQTWANGNVTVSTYRLEIGTDLSTLPSLQTFDNDDEISEAVKEQRYSIQKIETGADSLTPKRKLAYRLCGVIMVAAPATLAFAAIFLCSIYFYRRKLKQPLELLSDATKQIAGQNLDFEIAYDCNDEMGGLCHSFEDMRLALYENNKAMWSMLEERRLMQASVAHDLRNPIAIIKGYTEYLEAGLAHGEMSREKMSRMIHNLGESAERLEQYTESVRLLNQLEEMQLSRKTVAAARLADDVTEDLALLAEQKGIILHAEHTLVDKEIQVDSAVLYRILENLVNNAVRYAKKEILLTFTLSDMFLFVTVTDDGDGFSSDILNRKKENMLTADKDGHMGIGLAISRLLCRKHGGDMELSNVERGACVKISLLV